MEALRTVAWLVCGIYATIPLFWLVIHPFADFWRRRYRAPLKVLVFVWIALWLIAWTASFPWRQSPLWPQTTAPYPYREVIGWGGALGWGGLLRGALSFLVIPLWATSLFIYFGGQRHFSIDQVIGRNELEPDRQPQILVTTGLHAHMRHPLYFGHLCTMLGWLVLVQSWAVLGLLAFAILTGIFMIRTEDAELERRFGPAYRAYRQRTPAVLPEL
jgi:protein-S-isoprenylcysteine O-methyltransferase Ste14